MTKRGSYKRTSLIGLWVLVAMLVLVVSWLYLKDLSFPMIQTKGIVAEQQINLFYVAMLLMSIVVIPVFIMAILFPIKYREKHAKKRYQPHWQDNRALEFVYWGVPIIIITILGTITWYSSHSLDPFRPIESDKSPLKIQVIALEWKWLFIYPEARVASVNEVTLPVNRPVEFEITSDAPMNSFQIPALGGQIYAMSGMRTKLNLMAKEPGAYRGFTNNLSGEGYADMNFMAYGKSVREYSSWIKQAKSSRKVLDMTHYKKLANPQKGKAPVVYYGSIDSSLYDTIVHTYMGHEVESNTSNTHRTSPMEHTTEGAR